MVRTSPRTTLTHVAATLVAASLLLAGVVSLPAHADDRLTGRKHQVEKRLVGAGQDLDESSAQVRSAAAALLSARSRLGQAQARLADTRGRLSAAQALDAEMASRLSAAEDRLRAAQADLMAGRDKVVEQRDTLGRLVVSSYQTGDPTLLGLSMVLSTQDPTELTGQLNSVGNVMDKESAVLHRLEASRALLAVQAQEVAAARLEVAGRRRAAADNLVRKRSLEARAHATEEAVRGLVAARLSAQRRAEAARLADLAQLRGLRAEQERITTLLRRRADAARARARAAAAARHSSSAPAPVVGQGGGLQSGGYLSYPVNGPVTSPYGWRVHPIFGYRSLHDGDDFGAACGTPVRAAAPGRVLEEYFQAAWGNRLIIDHGFHDGVGLATISNHLSSYAVGVGAQVSRGQVVGYVGTTGWSTGCHLHFTVLQDGVAVDPMTWF
ncbi:MAG TPA: M23 family metallopeptidase [Nocardioidaceae bacterium]|nr:M23 family metallopeptidase [Nocardioidaceae bacterium]